VRAALISELGRPPEVVDRPEPSGEATYEISAVSLNPVDINVGAGRYFGGHPELPYVPGCEGVGRAHDGTRVYLFGEGLGLFPATDCWRSVPPPRPTSASRSRTRSLT
jgi:NADPH2:quinone reductase